MASSNSQPTDALKDARRRRFFAAISTSRQPAQHQSTSQWRAPEKFDADSKKNKESTSSTASATKSSSTSPLSPEATEKLLKLQRSAAADPNGFNMPTTDLKTQNLILAMVEAFMTAPPSSLPPELGMAQRQVFEMRSPLDELEKASMESLPPELQQLKRSMAEGRAKMPDPQDPYGIIAHGRRVNDLLRANGEAEFPFDSFEEYVPGGPKSHKVYEVNQKAKTFLADLRVRKPHLFMAVGSMLQEFSSTLPNLTKVTFSPTR